MTKPFLGIVLAAVGVNVITLGGQYIGIIFPLVGGVFNDCNNFHFPASDFTIWSGLAQVASRV